MDISTLLAVIAVGLVFGSFVTCMSYRLPRAEDVVRKPSYCPHCGTTLTVRDLVPLFSWLLAAGRCRHCRVKISVRYPLTELATAFLFVLCYLQLGVSMAMVLCCLMVVALMVMIVVDLEHYIIPDSVHVALIPLGIAFHYIQQDAWEAVALSVALLGSTALILHYGYSYVRGRVMLGFGDVKFFAVAGLWLGLVQVVPFLFLAGVFGILLGIGWRLLGKG